MGWKGTLRSINAASKRYDREVQLRENAENRVHDKIDKNIGQIMKKADSFEKKIYTNPIKALSLQYQEGIGLTSEPFELASELFNGTISLTPTSIPGRSIFSPLAYTTELFSVTPLELVFTRWGFILAIQIENFDSDYRIRTPWFKKSEPQSSSAYILDPTSSKYYYPIASSLSGEVIAGHPKIGLLAFEPFSDITTKLQLHISNVKLTKERSKKHTFHFDLSDESVETNIQVACEQKSLVEQLQDALTPQVETLRSQLQSKSSGCLVLLGAIVSTLVCCVVFLIYL